MIEKIINNYLTNALVKCFKKLAIRRCIDLLVISKKSEVSIYAKYRKYTTDNYKKIITFDKSASIYYLCNLIETNKEFDEKLKEYQKKEVKHG